MAEIKNIFLGAKTRMTFSSKPNKDEWLGEHLRIIAKGRFFIFFLST